MLVAQFAGKATSDGSTVAGMLKDAESNFKVAAGQMAASQMTAQQLNQQHSAVAGMGGDSSTGAGGVSRPLIRFAWL